MDDPKSSSGEARHCVKPKQLAFVEFETDPREFHDDSADHEPGAEAQDQAESGDPQRFPCDWFRSGFPEFRFIRLPGLDCGLIGH